MRGQYPDLRTIDALQISAAIEIGVDVFITNDKKLKQIKDINVLVLKEYLLATEKLLFHQRFSFPHKPLFLLST